MAYVFQPEKYWGLYINPPLSSVDIYEILYIRSDTYAIRVGRMDISQSVIIRRLLSIIAGDDPLQ